jgi:hypothetical protein
MTARLLRGPGAITVTLLWDLRLSKIAIILVSNAVKRSPIPKAAASGNAELLLLCCTPASAY